MIPDPSASKLEVTILKERIELLEAQVRELRVLAGLEEPELAEPEPELAEPEPEG